ncbi:flagellar filament capping protein FliD [Chitinibacter sp. SCUT-21]|uniref:flagellar filament capping protein FliD n=1 Tax=Chitinibacter sp. SCUT-21 TaxID=2970891 RepID=UPI0035A73808
MPGITASGIGSGLDVQGIVSKLVEVEKEPLKVLDKKELGIQATISAVGTVKSGLSALQTALAGLLDINNFTGIKSNSSATDVLTAQVGNAADPGIYSIDVLQLAASQRVTSKVGVFTGDSQVLANVADVAGGVAKIKLEFGAVDGSNFNLNSDKNPVEISVSPKSGASTITLADVKDAINNSKSGIGATIVQDTPGSARLVINAGDGGAKNAFKLSIVNGAGTQIDKLAYDPTNASDPNFSVLNNEYARDAKFKLNGVEINRPTNSISDALKGVTIDLWKSSLSDPADLNSQSKTVRLEVRRDSLGAEKAIEGFVKSYNELRNQVVELTKYDAKTGKGAILQGENSIQVVMNQLRQDITSNFPDGTGQSFNSLGVSFDRYGAMIFAKEKFTAALKVDPANVASSLGAYDKKLPPPESAKNGIAFKINASITQLVDKGGVIGTYLQSLDSKVKSINQQRVSINQTVEQAQARYLKQFNALDLAVAKMRSTGDFLTSQLAALKANNN